MRTVPRLLRHGRTARAARMLIAAAVLVMLPPIGAALADQPLPMTSADVEQLLAKVKAEHPNASILKIERERSEDDGKTEVYEVKLLRSDGQVLKLYYDAATLAPVAHTDDDDKGEHRHRRERRRGHW